MLLTLPGVILVTTDFWSQTFRCDIISRRFAVFNVNVFCIVIRNMLAADPEVVRLEYR